MRFYLVSKYIDMNFSTIDSEADKLRFKVLKP